MSIATQTGDGGATSLAGGGHVSKADLRVEAYGTVDELNATLGFARSLCQNAEIALAVEEIQKTLFRVGAALAASPASKPPANALAAEDVDTLTQMVHAIEAQEGILADWSLPGAHSGSAAFEVARTVCRRAERAVIRLAEREADEHRVEVQQHVIPYLNRLSDLIWLFARQVELEAGIDSSLREGQKPAARWSRAW